MLPSIIGESWFGVEVNSNSPLLSDNQAQPDPKRVVAALANSSLKESKLPNLASIASANAPEGFPPPVADNNSQNNEWLA